MRTVERWIFIAIVLLLMVVPAMFTNVKREEVSYIDGRYLKEWPEETDENYLKGIEGYFGDRIGFRPAMITGYQYLCEIFFHKITRPMYEYGDNEQIYSTWDLINFQHLDCGDYPRKYSEFLSSMQGVCESLGSEFYFIMPPSKETIYYEDYPKGYNIANGLSRTELMEIEFDEDEVNYVSSRSMLLDAKVDIKLYNSQYDVSHYNMDGMYICFKGLYERMRQDFAELEAWDDSNYERTMIVQKYRPQTYFVINEEVPRYTLVKDASVDKEELFDLMGTAPYHRRYINEDSDGLRILFVGDSYLDVDYGVETFYKPYFKEIIRIHSDNEADILYYVSTIKPDIVVLEATERTMQKGNYAQDKIGKEYIISTVNDDSDVEIESFESGVMYEDTFCCDDGKSYVNAYTDSISDEVIGIDAVVNDSEYVGKRLEDNSFVITFRAEDLMVGTPEFYLLKAKP